MVAVIAYEHPPANIRAHGGVVRMRYPELILQIMEAMTIPIMANYCIGYFVEAQILEELSFDYIDESELLTPANERHQIDKHPFEISFVCSCCDLGDALQRISEGATMIRTKGEAGTGDIVERIRSLAASQMDEQIAAQLNAVGLLPVLAAS